MAKLEYKPYQRTFSQPLQTAHGIWSMREGIILRLERDDGSIGYGEVAPVPWFGTETLEQALIFLKELRADPTLPVPKGLPCTEFAWFCAQGYLDGIRPTTVHVAGLLPACEAALEKAESLLSEGYTTLKWKIGVGPVDAEQRIAVQLSRLLHERGVLRLDANGALDQDEANSWMHCLRDYPVDYIEQPMPVGQEAEMRQLAKNHGIMVAFDESVVDIASLNAYSASDQHGTFIVKPALIGSFIDFQVWWLDYDNVRAVYSSVFETAIGFEMALRMVQFCRREHEVHGFGTLGAFPEDGLGYHQPGATLTSGSFTPEHAEALWKRL
ncbi:MAG: o-succinylbenzoate synthase [Verrucomicrobiota bacterium]